MLEKIAHEHGLFAPVKLRGINGEGGSYSVGDGLPASEPCVWCTARWHGYAPGKARTSGQECLGLRDVDHFLFLWRPASRLLLLEQCPATTKGADAKPASLVSRPVSRCPDPAFS